MEQSLPRTPAPLLATRLRASNLFTKLDAGTLSELKGDLRLIRLSEGEILFRQGDPGDSLYVLLEGQLSVTIERADGTADHIDELTPIAHVGEMALLTGRARTATVAASRASELVRLSRAGFDRLLEQNPVAISELTQAMLPRVHRTELVGVLDSLFGSLDKEALHELQAELEWQHLASGDILYRQGEPGDALYLVVNGRLRMAIEDGDGTQRILGEVTRGASIGEADLLTEDCRSYTVSAIRDSDVVRLRKPSFERLVEQNPNLMLQISRFVAKRLRGEAVARDTRSDEVVTFAVLPTGDASPLTEFAGRFAEALSVYGPTLLLSSTLFDTEFGREGIAQTPGDAPADIALVAWLSEQETKYRFIVYEADREWSAWTRRCVRQTDRLLLLGHAGTDPTPGPVETELARRPASGIRELVLVQPEGQRRPVGTRLWLNQRSVHGHHHVRLHLSADMASLAQRLTGRATGLVLGGGGARGYAHIGVIRALEEAGLHIDILAGTSMGALIAGLYATGLDTHSLLVEARRFGSRKQLFDYTLPLVSFLASRKVTAMLHTVFGDISIEDLWRPFFCVSSNLSQARPVVHRQGPLWEAVRASLAIPGVFSPVYANGDLLVDGGVMNNLPVDVMRDLVEEGLVIASNVNPERDLMTYSAFGPAISGWSVLWSRLNPFAAPLRLPSILETLSRSRELNDAYQRQIKRQMSDLFIAPPVERFQGLDFRPANAISEVGYQAGRQAILEWRRSGEPRARLKAALKA